MVIIIIQFASDSGVSEAGEVMGTSLVYPSLCFTNFSLIGWDDAWFTIC